MEVHVQDGMNEAFFQDAVDAVTEKIEGLGDIPVDIVAIENPRTCDGVVKELPIEDEAAFKKNCEDALTSVSYRTEGHELIVIKADKQFVKEDRSALRGLLAHELMHVVHRHSGVEDDIQETAKTYSADAIRDLRGMGLSDGEIGGFIGSVFATAIFCLKDIYANRDLIDQSFTGDLEAYYYKMLGLDGYCRVPDFYGDEATLEDVENALAFELGLLPAWLPFRTLDRDTSDKIRRRIQECYERDIPHVAEHVHRLIGVYDELFDDPDEFKHAFFEQVLQASYRVLEEKLDVAQPPVR